MSDTPRPGILPCQAIDALIAHGAISAESAFDADQVQPASLDLRLGGRAWRVRASFLPGAHTVRERIATVAMHEVDLTAGAVLERGCVYIAELQERLKLPAGVSARANPKSSTGRVDVFVRLLTDHPLADMIGRRGHDLVHRRFCIELMVSSIESLYDEAAVRLRQSAGVAG